jgi:hypothetical protein
VLACFLRQLHQDTFDAAVQMHDKLMNKMYNKADKEIDDYMKAAIFAACSAISVPSHGKTSSSTAITSSTETRSPSKFPLSAHFRTNVYSTPKRPTIHRQLAKATNMVYVSCD